MVAYSNPGAAYSQQMSLFSAITRVIPQQNGTYAKPQPLNPSLVRGYMFHAIKVVNTPCRTTRLVRPDNNESNLNNSQRIDY
jgi:hypothetical protein